MCCGCNYITHINRLHNFEQNDMQHIIDNLGSNKVTQEIHANQYEQGRSIPSSIFAPVSLLPSPKHLQDAAIPNETNITLLEALYNVPYNTSSKDDFAQVFEKCWNCQTFKPLARVLNMNVIIIQRLDKVSCGMLATSKQAKTALVDTRETSKVVTIDTLLSITDMLLDKSITDAYIVSKLYSATQLKRLAQTKHGAPSNKMLKADLIKLILGT